MFVERLELVDFRSYVRADVPMAAGATTFIGSNGQGKTNLVEAVEYLSTLSSHRSSSANPSAGHSRGVEDCGVFA